MPNSFAAARRATIQPVRKKKKREKKRKNELQRAKGEPTANWSAGIRNYSRIMRNYHAYYYYLLQSKTET